MLGRWRDVPDDLHIEDVLHVAHLLTESVSDREVAGSLATWFKPTGETYLRLAEVDLGKPEAILEFVNWYGLLGGAVAYYSLERELASFFEFRFAARCLRDLYSSWKMFKSNGDVADFEWVSPSGTDRFGSIQQPAYLLGGYGMLNTFRGYFKIPFSATSSPILAFRGPTPVRRRSRICSSLRTE